MAIIGALIGLIAGVLLTILSEIVKRASQKRLAAVKVYTESMIISKDILESDFMQLASLADIIFSDQSFKNIENKAKNFNIALDLLKKELLKDQAKLLTDLKKIKSDPFYIDKQINFCEIYEKMYKDDKLILPKSELSFLSPKMQPLILELIDNHFHCVFHMKYFLLRLKLEEIDLEKNLTDFIEVLKFLIKIMKDRKTILDYSEKLSNKNLIQLLFDKN